MNEPIIQACGLSKKIPMPEQELVILSDIDLDIQRGESVAITGASGSGKSTLLGLLAGLDQPSSGTIRLLENELTQLDEDSRAAVRLVHVGFVFQSFHLMPHLTALENVMLPLELESTRRQARQQALDALRQVGLEQRSGHLPNQLSGGEQQRVALARAFVIKPDILFADEPTGNLDEATGREIITLLFDLQRNRNTTLVLITHDASLAQRCERQFRLVGGRLAA